MTPSTIQAGWISSTAMMAVGIETFILDFIRHHDAGNATPCVVRRAPVPES